MIKHELLITFSHHRTVKDDSSALSVSAHTQYICSWLMSDSQEHKVAVCSFFFLTEWELRSRQHANHQHTRGHNVSVALPQIALHVVVVQSCVYTEKPLRMRAEMLLGWCTSTMIKKCQHFCIQCLKPVPRLLVFILWCCKTINPY